MGFFYIFAVVLAAALIRTISFAVWHIKNRCVSAGFSLLVLAVLTTASGILFILT